MIAIVDYGVGNLFSLSSSVRSLGAEVRVTRDAADLRAADHILLPGVGAFADAMAKLEATGLVPVLREETQKKPLLGICLGMQLLFEKSCEYGEHRGLGLISGEVCEAEVCECKAEEKAEAASVEAEKVIDVEVVEEKPAEEAEQKK